MSRRIGGWLLGAVVALGSSGCGYLDHDLGMGEEAFAQSLSGNTGEVAAQSISLGAMHLYGCGGVINFSEGSSRTRMPKLVLESSTIHGRRARQRAQLGGALAGGVALDVRQEGEEEEREEVYEPTPAEVFAANHEAMEVIALTPPQRDGGAHDEVRGR